MRYNKNLNILSNLLINCILLRSASKILSTKVEYTFLFLKILIIGLYSSSADFLFEIFLFLVAPRQVSFIKKIYKQLKQEPFDIHHIYNF